ncbi:membrane protein [Raphidocelis subcapitata]|uniref:Membrane protein n=1 Tax=Raphidocelis subcapitata TaxID=307507 RepID=A0A2V0NNS2_9CHLO|nr:membrane protein [Raphidocelis subcapitata]|eukprot:GBF88152.1 membrane protein [Raphidocelis subcapitata]
MAAGSLTPAGDSSSNGVVPDATKQWQQQQQADGQQPRAAAPRDGDASSSASASGSAAAAPPPAAKRGGAAGVAAALLGLLGGLTALAACGYLLREPIRHFLNFFITAVEEWGPWGYVVYILVYAGLEIFAVPAIPLTMTAGAIFGQAAGTAVVVISALLAAAAAFLIARYLARDRILAFAQRNKRFAAIDRAISRDGLRFVTLLRLSPLLPLALSNYFYGLTSVDLGSYLLGTCVGILPGTYAYVTAGHVGKAVLLEGGGAGALGVAPWQVGLGVGASLLAIAVIGQMARKAIEEADADAEGGGRDAGEDAAAAAAAGAAAAGGAAQWRPAPGGA